MDENILDRALYKQIKNMNRDEMEGFLKRVFENGYKKAIKDYDILVAPEEITKISEDVNKNTDGKTSVEDIKYMRDENMELGDFIKKRREQLKLSRNELAIKIGVSHTEIHRIEKGERKNPSVKILFSLADALEIRHEIILEFMGFRPAMSVKDFYPALKTQKQFETVNKIVEMISQYPDFVDHRLDGLCEQVEMYLEYYDKKDRAD